MLREKFILREERCRNEDLGLQFDDDNDDCDSKDVATASDTAHA